MHFYERFKTRASLVSKIRQKEEAEPLYISFFKQKMQFSYTKRFLISHHLTHIVTCSTMPHFICLSSYSPLSWNLQTIEWHYLPHKKNEIRKKKKKKLTCKCARISALTDFLNVIVQFHDFSTLFFRLWRLASNAKNLLENTYK